jgi:hypothetical protein
LIDQFIEITKTIIEGEGFEGFLPTLLLPRQKVVRVLDDVPEHRRDEQVAVEWASSIAADDEDYFLAFKLDTDHFKVIARLDGQRREQVVRV